MKRLNYVLTLVCLVIFLLPAAAIQDAKKYSIKTTDHALPQDLSEPIRALLDVSSIELLDPEGKPICDVWFRKEISAEATAEQIKSGVTYREVKQTEILAAIQFHVDWTDYRKQKIKAGVYTMRLAYQPNDGKHTAEFSEFQECALISSAKTDTKAALMEPRALHQASAESIGSEGHPGIFMLWPNHKPGADAALDARPKNHWVLKHSAHLVVAGNATGTRFGIGLTLVGQTPAE